MYLSLTTSSRHLLSYKTMQLGEMKEKVSKLTVSTEVARQSFLMRGTKEFFKVGYSISSAKVGMMLRQSSFTCKTEL